MGKKKSKGQWYKSGYVSQRILDTSIDYTRARMSDEQLSREYKRLGITQIANFQDLYENFKFKRDAKAIKYYRQYRYRDELIARGQYDEILAQGYLENMRTGVEKILGNDVPDSIQRALDNLDNLSPSQLVDIVQANSGEKGIFSKLPTIGMIYTLGGTINENGVEIAVTEDYIEKKVKQAFEQIGVQYDTELYSDDEDDIVDLAYEHVQSTYHNDKKFKYSDVLEIYTRDTLKNSKDDFIATYARRLPRSKISANVTTDTAVNALVEHYKSHISSIKVKKDGNSYIPFVKKKVSNIIISHIYGDL